ncbi:MAG: hypothetical protein COW00_06465 [Bdellovibrio sp. CG12_big_fil_rev_8_21_14_0_65_39_13]|nr:MAG: hypothetical protein COW78_19000 [Bdellovibrio sp. CG22_combo_CG10-13_8_21_14_all_39_27]PIQ60864.1 MAG: hypothetical protein COW00_06465 [Bdellovibrio sp. CG12_big_fil_rev_8_21_14_0_65_39_13]PIR36488.1 MAG: hypothetical protein COV37_03810 [Bdellovibrio sp. CG11_big_fil_rev_8_21_14_0_20_39_38]PJB52904.1 MAG: hypothetical protein CO099_10140 [Bdellovibrio sp. CG_4_9_14_3_um_filter_39_7]
MLGLKNSISALLLCLFLMSKAQASIILPLSFEDQLRTSDAVVQGVVQGQNFKRLANGEVTTEVVLRLSQTVGMESEIIVNPSQFKVLVPGGTWGGIVHRVDGTPDFKNGEEVVLFVSRFNYGIKLSSMALSKYQVVRKKDDISLKSYLYPENPNIGHIKFSEFKTLVSTVMNGELKPISNEKTVWKRPQQDEFIDEENTGRAPASISPASHIEMSWLMIIFALLGSGSWYLAKRD